MASTDAPANDGGSASRARCSNAAQRGSSSVSAASRSACATAAAGAAAVSAALEGGLLDAVLLLGFCLSDAPARGALADVPLLPLASGGVTKVRFDGGGKLKAVVDDAGTGAGMALLGHLCPELFVEARAGGLQGSGRLG